jgi:hypothetical protein
LTLGSITTSLFGVTNDLDSPVLISEHSSGDGALDRSNFFYSGFSKSSSIDEVSRPFLIAFGFDLNLMHPQSIFTVLPLVMRRCIGNK